jgi:hypothetical protein
MPKEFKVPLLEGQTSTGETTVRLFSNGEFPVKIGSLEREAFTTLGDWNMAMNKKGYGMAYRMGIKEGLIDDEGDPTSAVMFFLSPLAERGLPMTPAIAKQQYEQFAYVAKIFTLQAQQLYGGNILSLTPQTPKWMFDELTEELRKRNKH